MKHVLYLLGLLVTAGLPTAVRGAEILRWERLPLAVSLHVDQGARRLYRPQRPCRRPGIAGRPPARQSAGGAIYLRASEPIEPTRLQLQDADSGALILLDIAAEAAPAGQAPLEPVRIVEAEGAPTRYGDLTAAATADDDTQDAVSRTAHETPVPVVLTRYAAQNLYAPLRTVEPVSGITRVNLKRNLPLDTLLPTLPVRTRALAAWRLDGLWVTAVRLTNTSKRWLSLDPRDLQGDFMTGHSSTTRWGRPARPMTRRWFIW